MNEDVRVLRLDVEFSQTLDREVGLILRDDDLRSGDDRGSEDVAIIRIRRLKRRHQSHVPCHERIGQQHA